MTKSNSAPKSKTASSDLLVDSRSFFADLIESGIRSRRLETAPMVKSYLVEMLEFYLDARNLFLEPQDETGRRVPQTLAEMFLEAQNAEHQRRQELLKRLADKSLYLSGFFGDSLARKVVDIDYYANMGGAAYGALAKTSKKDELASVYKTFSEQFIHYVDVLTYASQKSLVKTDESVLRLYEKYLRTGSLLARERLIEMGVTGITSEPSKLLKIS